MESRVLETGAVIPSELSWDVVTLEGGEQGRGEQGQCGRGNGRQRAESPLGFRLPAAFPAKPEGKKQRKIPANLSQETSSLGTSFKAFFPVCPLSPLSVSVCLSPLSSPPSLPFHLSVQSLLQSIPPLNFFT